MNRPPSFQFYPKDWSDYRVQRMSYEAQGIYMRLLCYMWADSDDQCHLIDDDDDIARALGTTVEQWLQNRAEIQKKSDPIFLEIPSKSDPHIRILVSERLKAEAEKQYKYRKSQAKKGKSRGSTVVQPLFNRRSTGDQPEGKSSSSSSSSSFSSSSEEEISKLPKGNSSRAFAPKAPDASPEKMVKMGKEREPIPQRGEWPSVEALVDMYNALTPDEFPAVTKLSPARIEKTRKMLRQFPERQFWEEVFNESHRSKFLRGFGNGKGHSHWVADYDWFLAKNKDGIENALRVGEGIFSDLYSG
jgi:uncharacterized protein YdaU (DUF1376 family)